MNRRATIYIGQNLRIPVTNGIQVKKNKKVILKTENKIIKNSNTPKTATKKSDHEKIKKSAGLLSETPAKPVKDDIPINPDIITANLNFLRTFSKNGNLIGIIRVEPEETLGHYADWLQIPTQRIRTLNKFTYGKPISVEQKIKIPLNTMTIQDFEEKRYEFHKEIEEDFFASFVIQAIETYEVKSGDNIWSICINKLEVPFWLLKKLNANIHFNSLHPKQKIRYPIIGTLKTD